MNSQKLSRALRPAAVQNLGLPKPREAFEGFDNLFKRWGYSNVAP